VEGGHRDGDRLGRRSCLSLVWLVDRVELVDWFVGDEAKHVTGIQLPIDAGCTVR